MGYWYEDPDYEEGGLEVEQLLLLKAVQSGQNDTIPTDNLEKLFKKFKEMGYENITLKFYLQHDDWATFTKLDGEIKTLVTESKDRCEIDYAFNMDSKNPKKRNLKKIILLGDAKMGSTLPVIENDSKEQMAKLKKAGFDDVEVRTHFSGSNWIICTMKDGQFKSFKVQSGNFEGDDVRNGKFSVCERTL